MDEKYNPSENREDFETGLKNTFDHCCEMSFIELSIRAILLDDFSKKEELAKMIRSSEEKTLYYLKLWDEAKDLHEREKVVGSVTKNIVIR